MDSSVVQMKMHPPHGYLPESSFKKKKSSDYGHRGSALEPKNLGLCLRSQGASSPVAAHELEMSATFVFLQACVQPLSYMSNAATD